MFRSVLLNLFLILMTQTVGAATLRVPQDHSSIQEGIDASSPGDTILVAAGRYSERIRLKPGIILRSDGGNDKGPEGLRRTEATVIDGGENDSEAPGVVMAEGSTLDGFTITNVGVYDDSLWQKHFESQGEELGDDEGSVQAEGTVPAVSIRGVSCTVTNCIVHHNGDVGIGILGEENSTTAPSIISNVLYRNMGGGIGVAEGAKPLIRGNTCRENLRAGIGCRKANPIIVDNHCFRNIRAGIGCREGARPVIRANHCYENRRAGIGIRMPGTTPVVEGNECYENAMAGIGCRAGASPLIIGNTCRENKLVAIGVIGGSTALIVRNNLIRTTGVPPIIAVREDSTATIEQNHISGGGVAAVLIQGKAIISGNTFAGIGQKQGNAVWVWENSTATIAGNSFDGYRVAVNAKKANMIVADNQISRFQGSAIILKDCPPPVYVHGNTAVASDPNAKVVEATQTSGVIENNTLKHD